MLIRSLEILGGDKDRQLHTLWKETNIGKILPWDDIQRDDEPEGDETEPSEEVIFGQRRPDSLAIDWINKMVYVLEFKRTSDQRRDYREKGEARARVQHDVLIRSLEKVAGETESHCKKDIPVYRLLPHCLLQQPARGPCSGGGNDWHGLLLKACRYCSLC